MSILLIQGIRATRLLKSAKSHLILRPLRFCEFLRPSWQHIFQGSLVAHNWCNMGLLVILEICAVLRPPKFTKPKRSQYTIETATPSSGFCWNLSWHLFMMFAVTSVMGLLSWELSQIVRPVSFILAHSIAGSLYKWAKIKETGPQDAVNPSETNP